MTKTVFAFRILEPQIHPPRLKIREVRATRNFQIGILSRRPNLDVAGLGRTKAEITRTKFNYAVMQLERLQNSLGIACQGLMLIVGTLQGWKFNQSHLVELMSANDPSRCT